jgi:type IV pilus assembly protein PilY1
LISTFTSGGTCADTTVTCANKVGPVTAAPALSTDDTQNIWVFFGTGRYFSNLDKTNQDPQNFFGVKDCALTSPSSCDQTKEFHNLKDVSSVVVCTSCSPTANVSSDGGATFTVGFQAGGGNLVNNIQNMDGWVTNLPNLRERNFTQPTILGGTLFFTSFITSDDLCVSGGNGLLYALYYGTGTPYSASTIGTSVSGGNTIANASLSLGFGMPSQAAVQIGAQGTGAHGSTSNSGCVGRVTAFVQAGTGAINQFCAKPALQPWSRMISWRDL